MMIRELKQSPQRGVSLIELVLVTSMLGILARALVLTSDGLGRVTSSGNTEALLQTEAEKAARNVIRDLRVSGLFLGDGAFVNGKRYPFFFDGGVSDDAAFVDHEHNPADDEAVAGDADFGPDREIVFVLPSDRDGNGRPELDIDEDGVPELDGDRDGVATDDAADVAMFWDPDVNTIAPESRVVWAHDEISYVVNTAPDGINYLERRVGGAAGTVRRVAKHVERVIFENAADTGWAIPGDAVRMRLFLRKRTPEGVLMRHTSEIWVSLRNGGSMTPANPNNNAGI